MYLSAQETGGRVDVGVHGRHLDEAVDIVLLGKLGENTGSLNVNISEREVPISYKSDRMSLQIVSEGSRLVPMTVAECSRKALVDILGLVVTSEQVVDGIGVANGSLQRVLVAEVNLHGNNLSEIAHNLQVAHIILVTVRDNDMGTLASYISCNEINALASCSQFPF